MNVLLMLHYFFILTRQWACSSACQVFLLFACLFMFLLCMGLARDRTGFMKCLSKLKNLLNTSIILEPTVNYISL